MKYVHTSAVGRIHAHTGPTASFFDRITSVELPSSSSAAWMHVAWERHHQNRCLNKPV